MKKLYSLLLILFVASCHPQSSTAYGPPPDPSLQVSQYIRRMFQDKKGDLWFGTNGDGVARYDGTFLTYFTPKEGFGGRAVRGILQDDSGYVWFATDNGVTKYDPLAETDKSRKMFKNYREEDGLSNNQVWSILKDKKGILWFGTESGVSCFDPSIKIKAGDKAFTPFSLPAADLKNFPNAYPAPKLINGIYEDKTGNIWFASNGNGVYRYDGKSLVNFSEKDSLCNNFVQCVFQDKTGNFWFATRFGGLSCYDGKKFTNFDFNFNVREGLSKNFFWTIMEDKKGELWFGTAGGGLYSYNGKVFTNFTANEGLPNKFIQSILEDKNGTLWIGSSGGLFRSEGRSFSATQASFINVTKIGPWK